MILGFLSCPAFAYSGGDGSPEHPFEIWTAEQMNTIGLHPTDWNKCFILMANINMSAYTGTQYNIIGNESTPFAGTFDGRDNTISNLTITSANNNNLGLFGCIGSEGQVQNLCMAHAVINGQYNIGNFAGTNYGTVSQCHAGEFTLSAYAQVGGIVGMNYSSGKINQCYTAATGNVWGNAGMAGGITGYEIGTITRCYAACSVSSNTTNAVYTGGLAGYYGGKTYQSYATGPVTGNNYVGGLGGYLHAGYIYQSYATGAVTGNSYIGGLCGICSYSELYNCYSVGFVSGSANMGGLGGGRIGSIITSCFWDSDASGQKTSFFGTDKTTEQMQTLSTFTNDGWDFVGETANGSNDYWRLRCEAMSYPILSWQVLPEGDFVCPDGVAIGDFSYLAQRWLRADCAVTGNCEGPDMDLSGTVDLADLALFVTHWLDGM